ncbi:hypothetical protein O9993_15365 [Vibrio lentus]|nr:hypothetical protein [Vibrio lentus]
MPYSDNSFAGYRLLQNIFLCQTNLCFCR